MRNSDVWVSVREILHAGTVLVAAGLVVKTVSMYKDRMVAQQFGVSTEMDLFVVIFGVATFVVSLLANNMNSAFIPVYSGLMEAGRRPESQGLFFGVFKRMVICVSGIVLVGLVIVSVWAYVTDSQGASWQLVNRWETVIALALWVPISCASMVVSAALNGARRFIIPALTPSISSFMVMICIWNSGNVPLERMAWGIMIGGLLELIFLFRVLYRTFDRHSRCDDEAVRSSIQAVIRQYKPALAGGLLIGTAPIVDIAVAGLLPSGAISVLSYSNKVPSVVISILGGAVGTVVLPRFSAMVSSSKWGEILGLVRISSLVLFLLGLGVVVCVIFGSRDMIEWLYQGGQFHQDHTWSVAGTQAIYICRLPFVLLTTVFVRMISALRENKYLLFGTVFSASANLALDLILYRSWGARGIALATVFESCFTCVMLGMIALNLLRKQNEGQK